MKFLFAFALLLPAVALAQPQGEGGSEAPGEVFPQSGSLKRGEVNVRSGPGAQYPIVWVYWRSGYPVALLARFDNYLKIRDLEGEEGWVHQAMVSKRITALVAGSTPTLLLREPQADARARARLAPGVVVALDEPCTPPWCKVEVLSSGEKGYVPLSALDFALEGR